MNQQRQTSLNDLAGRFDEQFLGQCGVCRLTIPLPLSDGQCPSCGISWVRNYPPADVPALHAALTVVLAALTVVLAAAAPIPPAARASAW